jgi:hypothetical protein
MHSPNKPMRCGRLISGAHTQHAATPTARDSNLDSGNHDMPKLSMHTPAYLNDAPIHGLADMRLSCCQRILGVVPRTDTHNNTPTTLATQTPSRPPNYRDASNVDACRPRSTHPLGRCSLSFSSNTAPALASECVRWRECEMHKFGHRALSQET